MTRPFKLPLTALLLAITGCGDAIFYDRQVVILHLTDKNTGVDLTNAEVRAVDALQRTYYPTLSDAELWDRFGDPPSFTDESGRTDHAFRFVSICGGPIFLGLLFCNKISGDITNSDQFIRIKTDSAEDFLTITIAPNQSVAGNTYTITVEQIAAPKLDPDSPHYSDE